MPCFPLPPQSGQLTSALPRKWFVDNERKDMLEWWNDVLNPGEPVPDDVKLRDWYIGQRRLGVRNLLLAQVIKHQ